MKKYSDNTIGLYFEFPDEWSLEKDENILSLYDPINGVGAIQFSIYKVPDPKNIVLKQELNEYLIENGFSDFEIEIDCNYVYTKLNHDNKSWQYWMFLKNEFLIFLTYNCFIEDLGKENDIIEKIISSILS